MKKFSTYTLLQKSLVMSAIFFSLSGAFVNAMGGGGGPGEKEGGDGDKPPVPRTSSPSGTRHQDAPPPYEAPEGEERVFGTIAVVAAGGEVLEAQQREKEAQQELAAMRLQLAERDRRDAEERARRERELREEADARAAAAQRQQQEADVRAAELLRQQQETAAQMAALAAQMEALRTQQQQQPPAAAAPQRTQFVRPVEPEPQSENPSLGKQAERFVSALSGRKGDDKQREALRHPGKFFKF